MTITISTIVSSLRGFADKEDQLHDHVAIFLSNNSFMCKNFSVRKKKQVILSGEFLEIEKRLYVCGLETK